MSGDLGRVSGYYAGAFTRLAAFIVDWLIIVTVYGLVLSGGRVILESFFGAEIDFSSRPHLWIIGLASWAFLYVVVGLTVSGRTLGKTLLGIKVVKGDGTPITAGRAAARVFVLPFSIAIFGLGLLGIVVGRKRRALHDVVAGSAVVYDWGDRPAELPAPLTRWLESKGVDITPSTIEESAAPQMSEPAPD